MEFAWSGLPDDGPLARDSGDPLGFRAVSNRIARDLVPGLTQATTLVRGYLLLALGLDIARASGEDPDECFQRFERLWVLSQVSHEGMDTKFAGKVRAARLIENTVGPVSLRKPLLVNQLSVGLWGSYRRSSQLFGLIRPARGGGTRPSTMALTVHGADLAKRARDGTTKGRFQWGRYVKENEVDLTIVRTIRAGSKASPNEKILLGWAMGQFDRGKAGALGNLHGCYGDAGNRLTLGTLTKKRLSARQWEARTAARSLLFLMDNFESPFRHWITSGSGQLPPKSIWASPHWARVSQWDRGGNLRALWDRGSGSKPKFDVLQSHHEWLYGNRGAVPWVQGEVSPTKAQFDDPDFGLTAPRRLFAEGLKPHG